MMQTTPAFHPEGCPSRKKTLQRAEQDQLENPCRQKSQVLVWFGSYSCSSIAPPEQSVQQLQAGHEDSQAAARGLA